MSLHCCKAKKEGVGFRRQRQTEETGLKGTIFANVQQAADEMKGLQGTILSTVQ
jgi:hypothetical protein